MNHSFTFIFLVLGCWACEGGETAFPTANGASGTERGGGASPTGLDASAPPSTTDADSQGGTEGSTPRRDADAGYTAGGGTNGGTGGRGAGGRSSSTAGDATDDGGSAPQGGSVSGGVGTGVQLGDAPQVRINHPGNDEARDPCPGDFPFIGEAEDTEDGTLSSSLRWSSDLDGELGRGASFNACLSSGAHTITARVEDSDGNVGSATVSLVIRGDGGGGGAGQGGASSGGNAGTDTFERSTIGPDWDIVFPSSGSQVQIVDGALGMGPGSQGFFLINWVGSSFSADQFCEATLADGVDPDWLHQVYVRWRSSDRARYGFGYDGDTNQENYGDWIFKYDGVPSADTRIIAASPADNIPGPGDVLRVEIEGFTLRGYFNGDLVLEARDDDPSRIESGLVGLAARWAQGNVATTEPVKVWESWTGGSL